MENLFLVMICTSCLLKRISRIQFSMQIWTREAQALVWHAKDSSWNTRACSHASQHNNVVIKINFTMGQTIRKVMGEGVGNFRAARIFFVNISLACFQEYFFPYAGTFFAGLLAVHELFSRNFPLHEYFCTSSPPPTPIIFLMARPYFATLRETFLRKKKTK